MPRASSETGGFGRASSFWARNNRPDGKKKRGKRGAGSFKGRNMRLM